VKGVELACATPDAWLEVAVRRSDVLLVDHANCEKKAAGTALSLLYRYVDRPELLVRLSRLAREELRHFERVLALMADRSVDYVQLTASRYASALRLRARTAEPGRLIDTLLIGALVEARSTERMKRLVEVLDGDHRELCRRLEASEARHSNDYLRLAARYDDGTAEVRLAALVAYEGELILAPDRTFRFHSGVPAD
jgi:tRNA-(ms[2]io[6]A)-hydroxylase